MKKLLCIFLSISLLLAAVLLCGGMLSACTAGKKAEAAPAAFDPAEPLTVCFDLDSGFDGRHYAADGHFNFTFTGADARESAVKKLLAEMKEQGGPENVACEFIEGRGEARDGALTRLRAELMAGSGPDVFVISHDQYSPNNLFKFVEKKMEENVFMPLDAYTGQARFMDASRMNQTVLDGGKNAAGQQMLIPLRYTFSATVLPASETELDLSRSWSFADMTAGEDPALAAALAGWRNEESALSDFAAAFGEKADYKEEALTFSREDLQEMVEALLAFGEKADGGQWGDIAEGAVFTDLWDFRLTVSNLAWGSQPVVIVPLFNRQGGVTAKIRDYAGVNANTKNPAGAFWAVDFICGESQMQAADFHMYLNSHGLPVYDELMREDTKLLYRKDRSAQKNHDYIYFEEGDWQAVAAARDKLDSASFPTELDLEINFLLYDINAAADEAQRQKLIDGCYKKLEMLLGES